MTNPFLAPTYRKIEVEIISRLSGDECKMQRRTNTIIFNPYGPRQFISNTYTSLRKLYKYESRLK